MSRQSLPVSRWEIREEMDNLHGGTRMLGNQEVADAIAKVTQKYDVRLISVVRNIQLSVDVQLDHRSEYGDSTRMESKIRKIKGVVINDIYYREGNYKDE